MDRDSIKFIEEVEDSVISLMEDEVCRDQHVAQVVPGLYIADYKGTEQCAKLGVVVVVSCTEQPAPKLPPYVRNLHLKYFDDDSFDVHSAATDTIKWLLPYMEQGAPVMIHCNAGVSRSATLVMACLLYQHPDWTIEQAFRKVQQARAIACPDHSHLRKLVTWRNSLSK